METSARIEESISDAVASHLEAELDERGLLLAPDRLAAAEAEAARRGASLRTSVLQLCYPQLRESSGVIEFGSGDTAARLDAALAFGAVTARVLAERDADGTASSVELLCATFNLGIGLVDGLCDDDAEAGGALLELIEGSQIAKAAEEPPARGWLRSRMPSALVGDPTVAFTVDIIEAFFETLHTVHPDDGWRHRRRRVGMQLGAALEAERQSIIGSTAPIARDELIACSRLTSVLPFQIIETLAGGDDAAEPAAGTRLGEAMWRIDDLVDVCQDARRGSLNGVLLAAAPGAERPEPRDILAALERLPDSADIADVAAEAAEDLRAGLRLAGGDHEASASFLHFIQRYAGIPRRRTS